ncbi:hypothetical protein [Paenibacillus ferrarius]|uniref:hypothetical protein n=1 Tax=Paenibacillus ferrarius TaxID=1469647 RepID=UPI003D2CD850
MEQAALQQLLTEHGFERTRHAEISTYRLNISHGASGNDYPFIVTAVSSEEDGVAIHWDEARFEGTESVPLQVRKAALEKLIELEKMLNRPTGKTIEEADNGSMSQDMQEVKKLGAEMKHMKTNSEVMAQGLIPDPIQS